MSRPTDRLKPTSPTLPTRADWNLWRVGIFRAPLLGVNKEHVAAARRIRRWARTLPAEGPLLREMDGYLVKVDVLQQEAERRRTALAEPRTPRRRRKPSKKKAAAPAKVRTTAKKPSRRRVVVREILCGAPGLGRRS